MAKERIANRKIELADADAFNTLHQGKQVTLFFLRSSSGLQATITNYGGRIISLVVADKNKLPVDVAVGYDNIRDFLSKPEFYYGALIGRYGNRIANGKFSIDGTEYILAQNNNKNNLHGGPKGFHTAVWDAKQINQSVLELSYVSKDGEEGFPGNLQVKVTYTLQDNGLLVAYEALTDKTTVCNLTQHTYFNLNGCGSGTISNHLLLIDADHYTPVNDRLIPLGQLETVADSPFDFRKPITIGTRLHEPHQQLIIGNGYDHNYVLNGTAGTIRLVAEAASDQSGIIMQVHTTEPGMQLYGGNFMSGQHIIKYGAVDEPHTGFCLETQHFPDSPNQPGFPSTILKPGERYLSSTRYDFSLIKEK